MKTKFRAFYPETKQMIYGNANRAVIDFEGKVLVMDNISGNYVVPKDFVLMQSTGLHDKNGKEIYEGDIVQTGEEFGEVKYSEQQSAFIVLFQPHNKKQKSGCANLASTWPSPSKEIIGNIYENPELLSKLE